MWLIWRKQEMIQYFDGEHFGKWPLGRIGWEDNIKTDFGK
jgi:hypothetical protein